MSPKLSRRDFLKLGALTAVSVLSGCTAGLQRKEYLESHVLPPEEGLPGEDLWYASTCRQCSAGCGILVRVSEGRARKIEGNPDHPVNRGKLCARGHAALQELYDPDRLKNAVRQAGGRGSWQFEPVYWEAALEAILPAIRQAAGQVVFWGGNTPGHLAFLAGRFVESLGGQAILYTLGDELEGRAALLAATQAMLGANALPYFDIGNAEVVLSFGANFLETWLSPVQYGRGYAQMRRGKLGKRGYLVQFEPRMSATAACADEWVAVRPGGEVWAALALGNLLLERGQGGPAAGLFADVDAGPAAALAGVPPERLERIARLLLEHPRAVALPGGTLAGGPAGVEAMRAVLALNLALGQVGRPGGVLLPERPAEEGFAPTPVATFAQVREVVEEMRAGRVSVLMLHGNDPLLELPAAVGLAEALRAVPLVLSFSPTVNETAAYADWVLPDHTGLESWGYQVPAVADRPVVGGMQPVVRPLYDTRATADVLLALARGLGLDGLPWRNEVEFLRERVRVWWPAGLSEEAGWGDWRRKGGWWPDEEAWGRPTAAGPGLLEEPARLAGEAGEETFHLHLYPAITLFDGRGANKPWLQETPDPMTTVSWQTWVEVHPEVADRLGLEDGQVVRVVSPYGEIDALVYRFPGIRPDVVAIPVGRGQKHSGRFARGHGSNPTILLPPDTAGESLPWAAVQVRLEPTGRRRPLARLESAEGVAFLQEGH